VVQYRLFDTQNFMSGLIQSVIRRTHLPNDFSPRSRFYRRLVGWSLFCAFLSVAFAKPLIALGRFALGSELCSYIVLIPLMSIYLLWLKRNELLSCRVGPVSFTAIIPVLAGVGSLVAYRVTAVRGWTPTESDYLSITIGSFVSFVIAGFLFFFGRDMTRTAAFPIGFLIFMVPLPILFTDWLEEFLQYSSADAASALLNLFGATVYRKGLLFHLPGIVIEVAKECSGIHSTLVLFVTSLLAGHLFLQSPWKKAALALAVVPLGIARNGFRIFTISMLCVHVGPAMIDSPIHHRGGPIFFALSLVPFLALLFVLCRSERRRKNLKSLAAEPPVRAPDGLRISAQKAKDSSR
jgi:exosortase C (VPDSG-CTERM-specific)